MLNILAAFEVLVNLLVGQVLCYICSRTRRDEDGAENLKTISRDPLHNLAYPRSAPRSRMRYC